MIRVIDAATPNPSVSAGKTLWAVVSAPIAGNHPSCTAKSRISSRPSQNAGIATPTEAAGVGVVAALILTACYRALNWRMLKEALLSTVTTTAMTLLILIAAFGTVLTIVLDRATKVARERWGIEIEATHRSALHSALMSGIRAALLRGLSGADAVEAAITPRTKAIIPVHLYGQMVDMKRFRALADRHGLALIEDSAHGVEMRRDGIAPGQLGDAACFSFYATKTITSGDSCLFGI